MSQPSFVQKEVPTAPAEHVHVAGNPHYMLDPGQRPVLLTRKLAEIFARLEPAHAGEFGKNQRTLVDLLLYRIPQWKAELKGCTPAPERGDLSCGLALSL